VVFGLNEGGGCGGRVRGGSGNGGDVRLASELGSVRFSKCFDRTLIMANDS